MRDIIHGRDLTKIFLRFVDKSRPGEVYNIRGGRENSISLLEPFDLIEEVTGRRVNCEFGPER